MDINSLVNITTRAWALPVLAALHRGVPGRQASLLTATGAGRTALGLSFNHLISLGLLERNPGHGHPLRSEFRLTSAGISAAAMAHHLLDEADETHHPLLRRAWTAPVLATLQKPLRFNEIRRRLPPITDRALSQALVILENGQWVERGVVNTARPPVALYSTINQGRAMSEYLALALR
ncbi:MAG: winged helix-turn-helix transcriptional regulator [Pseudomonadota bacterium]